MVGPATNASIIDLALPLKPDITYLSATFGMKPLAPAANGGAPATAS
jgi:hypothetical protein